MSAIGSYVRMRTPELERCLALAHRPDDFSRAWASGVLEEVVFDGSGDLLSSYFLAQDALNGLEDPFDSADGAALGNVFTAAFAARAPLPLPDLDAEELRQFCREEWGDEGAAMAEGLAAAHAFFKAGMARITAGEAVVFIVS